VSRSARAPKGDGWFVLNAREARWAHGQGRPAICRFEGELHFPQLGIRLNVLAPGEPMAMYHWEADQEDFLVLAVGARDRSTGSDWGAYSVDQAALRHGAGVEQETTNQMQAYARFPEREQPDTGRAGCSERFRCPPEV
jgi:hypothetical protein